MLGAEGEGSRRARDRAMDFFLGRSKDERHGLLGRAVQHLIVCGGLLMADSLGSPSLKAALEQADELLATLADALPVDVLPGKHDPTNLSLPQLPLHPHLFRRVRSCRSFRSVSNPYECTLGGLHVMGHAGQPVEDILRCTQLGIPIEALLFSLNAMHLAPTAPDTLPAQPFADRDPFLLDKVPHVLFSGGHDKAEYMIAAPRGGVGTTCICVPAFHQEPAVVLVSLCNPRDVQVLHFGDVRDR
mmetsp:Transcript_104652/g.337420  ORF Transcript_104652/g.337420 Transcript_104652/m.337420 type:complete len:244 (+) Transcript_104652:455-1186(+)